MFLLGHINDRPILYTNIRTDADWSAKLPDGKWLAFVIADNEDTPLVNVAADICVAKELAWVCSVGEAAIPTEDAFDRAFLNRLFATRGYDSTTIDNTEVLQTTSDSNFDEGFWFAAKCAAGSDDTIDKIICLDFTEAGTTDRIIRLIELINNGWLPPDEDSLWLYIAQAFHIFHY